MRARCITALVLTKIACGFFPSLALTNIGIKTDNIIISPSVAKANFLDLGSDLDAAVDGGAEWLHFSIQDGRMVPKISFGAPIVAACRKKFQHGVVFDVKLGCVEPEHRVKDFIEAGADIISVHPESTLQLSAVLNKIQSAGVAAGVVLNPGTSVSAVEHVLDQCQVAVVMLVSLTIILSRFPFYSMEYSGLLYSDHFLSIRQEKTGRFLLISIILRFIQSCSTLSISPFHIKTKPSQGESRIWRPKIHETSLAKDTNAPPTQARPSHFRRRWRQRRKRITAHCVWCECTGSWRGGV